MPSVIVQSLSGAESNSVGPLSPPKYLTVVTDTADGFRPVAEGTRGAGEVYLNSIDRDGTGNGMDLSSLSVLGGSSPIPVILAGGAGKPSHLSEAIASPLVSAVATANLLNFVGDGLRKTRVAIRDTGIDLATWN